MKMVAKFRILKTGSRSLFLNGLHSYKSSRDRTAIQASFNHLLKVSLIVNYGSALKALANSPMAQAVHMLTEHYIGEAIKPNKEEINVKGKNENKHEEHRIVILLNLILHKE